MGTIKKARVALYLFFLFSFVCFYPNLLVAQTVVSSDLASPNSIVFQVDTDESKYNEGDEVIFHLEVTNLYAKQDTLYLSLYFPHIYEQMIGNPIDQKYIQYDKYWRDTVIYSRSEGGSVDNTINNKVHILADSTSENERGVEAIDIITWQIDGMDRNESIFIEFRMQIFAPLEFEDKTLSANLGLQMFDKVWDPYPTMFNTSFHILQSPCSWFEPHYVFVSSPDSVTFNKDAVLVIHSEYLIEEALDSVSVRCALPEDAVVVSSNPEITSLTDNIVIWNIGAFQPGDSGIVHIELTLQFTDIPTEPPYEESYSRAFYVDLAWSNGDQFCDWEQEIVLLQLFYPDFQPIILFSEIGDQCASPGYPIEISTQFRDHTDNWNPEDGPIQLCFYNDLTNEFIGSTLYEEELDDEQMSEIVSIIWDNPPSNPETVVKVLVNCDSSLQELSYSNNSMVSEPFCIQVSELHANMFSLGYKKGGFGVTTAYPDAILGFWHIFDQNNNPILNKAKSKEWISQNQQNERDETLLDVFSYKESREQDPVQIWDVSDFLFYESNNFDPGFEITVLADENSPDVRVAAADFVAKLPDKDFAYMKTYTGGLVPELKNTAEEMSMHDTQKLIFVFATDVQVTDADSIHHISNLSREYNIPVYTIALEGANEWLQQIADSTMGYYWNSTFTQVNSLNSKLVHILHHCYAFHYAAPYEGEFNHLWHTLNGVVRHESLLTEDSAWYLEPYGDPDLVISKRSFVNGVHPDSNIIMNTDVISYEIYVENRGILPVTDVVIRDRLPEKSFADPASINQSGSIIQSDSSHTQELVWNISEIGPEAIITLAYNCQLDSSWTTWDMCSQITNIAHIDTASIDQDLTNNTATDILTVHMEYGDPIVYTDNDVYLPRESVSIGCVLLAPCIEWRLVATQVDGSTQEFMGVFDSTMVINDSLHVLTVDEGFPLSGNELVENVNLTLYVTDLCGHEKSATTQLTLEAQEFWHLSHNAFNVNREINLFSTIISLAWESDVELKILDMSGRVIKDYGTQHQDVGESIYTWDLTDENSNPVGAGIYVVTLASQNLKGWKKFVLVR